MDQHHSSEPTILSSWVLGITRTIRSYGCDPEPLLREAGIDPDILFRYGDRVSIVETNRLWKLAVEATGDEAIGLRLPGYTTHSVLYSLDVAMQVAATPRAVLDCMVRFARVASTIVRLKVVTDSGDARVLFNSVSQYRSAAESMDAVVAYMMASAQRVFIDIGGFYRQVRMMREEPVNSGLYREVLGVDVEFGANEYSVLFDETLLDTPLPSSNPEMYRRCEDMLIKYLVRLEGEEIEERVKQVLAEILPGGEASRAKVASRLNMSERSLCRRLQERGISYQKVYDSVRQSCARSLLACRDMNQVEIAERLGFSDTSSFIRTFKRWMGQTPGQYRSSMS